MEIGGILYIIDLSILESYYNISEYIIMVLVSEYTRAD